MKKAFLQLHMAVFLAGFTGILGKEIHLGAELLVWYRLAISAGTMWILFYFTKKLKRLPLKDIMKLFGIGFVAALHWVTFYASIKESNVSVALVCFSSVGFFTALLEPVMLRVPIKWIEVLLGLLVMVGIYVIFQFDPRYKTGIILGITCAVLLAFVTILLREYVKRINPETILTYQLSGGVISLTLLLPLYWQFFPAGRLLPSLPEWGWLLVLSWVCSVWAFQLTTNSLKKLTAFTVNLTFNLEPVYGIIMAFLFYHENEVVGKWFFVGAGLIAASLVIHFVLLLAKERMNKKNANSLS
jgi:drug/metabolite transporter (DMT)-like permease